MWLYYTYLHYWVSVFGNSEIGLRSANIPLILIFSSAIVWVRAYLFQANWVWVAALSPLVWSYAADARPYMAILAFSTVFVTCVVASFTDSRHSNSRILPFTGLLALLFGMNMHMLTLLVLPPCVVLVVLYCWTRRCWNPALQHWLRAALFLSPVFLVYFGYLLWTFKRGTNYDYAQPEILSLGSSFFRLLGLSGFTPNRHYDLSFRPYLFSMVVGSLCLLGASAWALWIPVRSRDKRTLALLAALATGLLEAVVLTFALRQQMEVRHLTSLAPLVFFVLFSAWSYDTGRAFEWLAPAALVASVWLISDFRMTFLSDFRREDFRAAVAKVITMQAGTGANIAIVADPAAVAYYGLSVTGSTPCFPLSGTCQDALAELPWQHIATAQQANFWTRRRIDDWIANKGGHVVLISRSRHPMYLKSPWWRALSQTKAGEPLMFHGFFVYNFQTKRDSCCPAYTSLVLPVRATPSFAVRQY